MERAVHFFYRQWNLPRPFLLRLEHPLDLVKLSLQLRNSASFDSELIARYPAIQELLAEQKGQSSLARRWWKTVAGELAQPLLRETRPKNLPEFMRAHRPWYEDLRNAIDGGLKRKLKGLSLPKFAHHPHFLDRQWAWYYRKAERTTEGFEAYWVILEAGLWSALPLKSWFVWCPAPQSLNYDADGNLHNAEGPSIAWQHWQLYHWHGIPVSAKLIEAPESIGREDFLRERNAEVRRCFQERLGAEAFSRLFDLREIDRDTDLQGQEQVLLRTAEPDPVAKEFLQFARVTCPTTKRRYFLCVPPQLTSIWQAVAWTFGKEASAYRPDRET